jgi:hypothetical protein
MKKQTLLPALLMVVALLLLATGSAWANMAANATITNRATLSYNDGANDLTLTASVDVKVSLVPAQPNITPPGDGGPIPYNGPSTKLTNSFTVTATANGIDTYTLATAITGSTNVIGSPVAAINPANNPNVNFPPSPALPNVVLGASVALAGSTTTTIIVPADGTGSTNSVNGIKSGITVVIGLDTVGVSKVELNNPATTYTITLGSPLSAAPTAGTLVAQQMTINVDVTAPGGISGSATISKNLTVASTSDPTKTKTAGPVTDRFTFTTASLGKYVRNVTTPYDPTGVTPYTPTGVNTNKYYPSGITSRPGEVLEYLLVANSGTVTMTKTVIADLLPVDYVTFKAGAYGAAGVNDITYVNEGNVASTLPTPLSGAIATYNATFDTTPGNAKGKLVVNSGTGANASTGGSLAVGKTVMVIYQVTVK